MFPIRNNLARNICFVKIFLGFELKIKMEGVCNAMPGTDALPVKTQSSFLHPAAGSCLGNRDLRTETEAGQDAQ